MESKIFIYDFDGTFTPYPITRFKILEYCGLRAGDDFKFLKDKIKEKIVNDGLGRYEAIYACFFEVIKEAGYLLNDDNVSLGARELEYNSGVVPFLRNISSYNVKNYLVSSGIKVLLNRTIISKYFTDIYATTFKYNQDNLIEGIDFLMTDKKKVAAIKEILKCNGIAEDDCKNVVFVGDGLSDLYAMEYVKEHGGISVCVYLDDNSDVISVVKEKDVVSLFAYADYSEGSLLNNYLKEVCNK